MMVEKSYLAAWLCTKIGRPFKNTRDYIAYRSILERNTMPMLENSLFLNHFWIFVQLYLATGTISRPHGLGTGEQVMVRVFFCFFTRYLALRHMGVYKVVTCASN
jgi:hypothetical protein